MAFRSDEAASNGFERAKNYLIPRTFDLAHRQKAEGVLLDLVDQLGPVVEGYPTWHPLVSNHDGRNPETTPNTRSGYEGLDHTVYFAHGFITCPYQVSGKMSKVIDSVSKLPHHHCASITAEELEVEFYNSGTTATLVKCEWHDGLELAHLIPKRLAVPLMLERELPCWRWSQRAETWETMRPYLLGEPHGGRSSLFVGQETALAMKHVYMAMVQSGMFGPLKVN